MGNGGKGMNLKFGDRIKITGFNCGYCAEQKLCHMGILCGKEATIEAMQPSHGPVTLTVGRTTVSIGRGLFSKIEYVIIKGDEKE